MQIDFDGVGRLFSIAGRASELYREARTNANRNALLSELGPSPDAASLNALALRAAQSGDLAGANAIATLSRSLSSGQTDFIKNYQFAIKNGLQGKPFTTRAPLVVGSAARRRRIR